MELIPLAIFWVVLFELVRLRGMCQGESRLGMYSLAFGIWAIVAVYAVLHDQYIVRIAPAHFTQYHDPMWGIRYPKVLAAAYAFRSSWYPGLLLGIACTLAARADSMPRVGPRFVLKAVVALVLLTEFVAAFSGGVAYRRGAGIYPDEFYHDSRLLLQVTQTIQLTSYWMAALWSAFLIGLILGLRYGPYGPSRLPAKLAILAMVTMCGPMALAKDAKDALPHDFPTAEAIKKLWSDKVPGPAVAFRIATPTPISPTSAEGKAVRAGFNLIQRPKVGGIWRVGRRAMAGTKDIKPPDFKGQNNSLSNFSVCYVARTRDGYRLIESTEVWKWGQGPSFGQARVLAEFE